MKLTDSQWKEITSQPDDYRGDSGDFYRMQYHISRESIDRTLATVPEQGPLPSVCEMLEAFDGVPCNHPEEGAKYESLHDDMERVRALILSRRPAPEPAAPKAEPEAHPDDAAIVDEMCRADIETRPGRRWDNERFSTYQEEWRKGMTAALAVARKYPAPGMYTTEEIRDAGSILGCSIAAEDIIVELTAPPKPKEQDAAVEAVRKLIIGHDYGKGEGVSPEQVVAAVRNADKQEGL